MEAAADVSSTRTPALADERGDLLALSRNETNILSCFDAQVASEAQVGGGERLSK